MNSFRITLRNLVFGCRGTIASPSPDNTMDLEKSGF
jgi:hypothetical protein